MSEERNLSFWKRMMVAIKDLEKYGELATEKGSKVVKYFFMLIALCCMLLALTSVIEMGVSIQKGVAYIEENVESFSYQNGQMQVATKEERIQLEDEQAVLQCIIVDTKDLSKEEIEEYRQRMEKYENGMVFLKDKIFVKTSMLADIQEETYENINTTYGISTITSKEELLHVITGPMMYAMGITLFIICSIYLFVIQGLSFAIDAILFALVANITATFSRFRIRYQAAYTIAIYAGTLPLLLTVIYAIVRAFTGFTIRYFNVMYYSVWLIYIITVMLMIKSDLIKQQQELAKLAEEQERVKMQLETDKRREERQKQKEEKDKKDQQDKKETEDKKKKENKKQKDIPAPGAEMIQEEKRSNPGDNMEA